MSDTEQTFPLELTGYELNAIAAAILFRITSGKPVPPAAREVYDSVTTKLVHASEGLEY